MNYELCIKPPLRGLGVYDIFIDLDDTLYDTRGNAIHSLCELFEWADLGRWFHDASEFYEAYWEANTLLWKQYAHNEITREYLIIERFRRPLSVRMPNPSADYCLKLSDKFLDLCADKPGVIEGAHEVCRYLKQKGYRLHICSNGFHEIQYKKMRAARLIDFFDTIILSEDAGANKPSPKFYDYALATTGAKRETTLMIGDNYEGDILGAINSGIKAMFFRRWDQSFVPDSSVTYTVDTLAEISQIL